MFYLKKDMDIKDLRSEVYDFFNRYGFRDGERILQEEVVLEALGC